jgi:hypothetical protein
MPAKAVLQCMAEFLAYRSQAGGIRARVGDTVTFPLVVWIPAKQGLCLGLVPSVPGKT